MKRERILDWKAFQEKTINEMWEAWRKRKLFDVYRLARRAAGSKFGTKRRPYLAAQVAPPSEKEWLDQLSLPGSEGGMQATLIPSWINFARARVHEDLAPDSVSQLDEQFRKKAKSD
eukprot:2034683-Pyramimonas_sp.AAC.1